MKILKIGFTLVEFAIVIAVIAIIALMVIPGISSSMRGSYASIASNEFISGVGLARINAISHGYPVILCPANLDSGGGLIGCRNDNDWNAGVLIYQDNNLSDSFDKDNLDPELVKLIKFPSGVQLSISLSPAATKLAFDSRGNFSQAETLCFTNPGYSRRVAVNLLGVATDCLVGTTNCPACD